MKLFFGFTVLAAAWTLGSQLWYVAFPPASFTTLLLRLPAQIRQGLYDAQWWRFAFSTLWWVLVLGLASLAAFRRMDWARWAFAAMFLMAELGIPVIISIWYRTPQLMAREFPSPLFHPLRYATPALLMLAIILTMSRDARDWFRGRPN